MSRYRRYLLAGLFAPMVACGGSEQADLEDERAFGMTVSGLNAAVFVGSTIFTANAGSYYGVGVDRATPQRDGTNALNFDMSLVPGLYWFEFFGYSNVSGGYCEILTGWGEAEVRRGNKPQSIVPTRVFPKACGGASTSSMILGSDYEPGQPIPDYAMAEIRIANPNGDSMQVYSPNSNICLSASLPTAGAACGMILTFTETAISLYAYPRPHVIGMVEINYGVPALGTEDSLHLIISGAGESETTVR